MGTARALDAMFDPLARCLDAESARRLAVLELPSDILARVDILAEKANRGDISPEEKDEYDTYINSADVISILKLKTRHLAQGQ